MEVRFRVLSPISPERSYLSRVTEVNPAIIPFFDRVVLFLGEGEIPLFVDKSTATLDCFFNGYDGEPVLIFRAKPEKELKNDLEKEELDDLFLSDEDWMEE